MFPSESGRPPLPGSRALSGYCLRWDIIAAVRRDFDEVFPADAIVDWPTSLVACSMHDRSDVIGRISDGSFKIIRDEIGLRVELQPERYSIVAAVRTGVMRGWSINFKAHQDLWSTAATGRRLRTVMQATIYEVSTVTIGAHETQIHLANEDRRWSGNERDYVIGCN